MKLGPAIVWAFWLFVTHATVGLIGYGLAPRHTIITPPALYRPGPQPITASTLLGCPVTARRIIEYKGACEARRRQESIKEIIK